MQKTTDATLHSDVPETLLTSWDTTGMPGLSSLGVSSPIDAESVKALIDQITEQLLASLPAADGLTAEGRRTIIARYSSVLEGNFIYWMTGAYLASKSDEARSIVAGNLRDEVRDCHPGMLRKFTMAAHSEPKDTDALAVYSDLTKVRLFIGRLSPTPILAMMAFFEGFIQKFMPYLADLAKRQGSHEMEYTDVHGFCDVVHSQELYEALASELTLDSSASHQQLFEGVRLLTALIERMIAPRTSAAA